MQVEKYNILKEEYVCSEIIAEIFQDLSRQTPFLLGLCGGRSIARMLTLLDGISLPSSITGLLIDERALPLNHQDSNYRLIKEELDQSVNLKKTLELVPFDIDKEESSLDLYLSVLNKHAGIFDLVFLGIGEDGHIASIFPDLNVSHAIEEDYFVFEGSPKPPSKRITASHKIIEQARNVIIMIFGEGKRQAYENLLNPNISALKCPAKYALSAGRTIIFTDLE